MSRTSRTLCAQEQLYSASEDVRQAENKSNPYAVEIIKDGEKPSRIFLPLTFLDALHIQNVSILHLNTLFFKSLSNNTKELYVLKYYSDHVFETLNVIVLLGYSLFALLAFTEENGLQTHRQCLEVLNVAER